MMGYTTPLQEISIEYYQKSFLFSEMIATKTLIHSKNPINNCK